jgi:hypothetical protein
MCCLPLVYAAFVMQGKDAARRALRDRLGLSQIDVPIVGCVTRLVAQKVRVGCEEGVRPSSTACCTLPCFKTSRIGASLACQQWACLTALDFKNQWRCKDGAMRTPGYCGFCSRRVSTSLSTQPGAHLKEAASLCCWAQHLTGGCRPSSMR